MYHASRGGSGLPRRAQCGRLPHDPGCLAWPPGVAGAAREPIIIPGVWKPGVHHARPADAVPGAGDLPARVRQEPCGPGPQRAGGERLAEQRGQRPAAAARRGRAVHRHRRRGPGGDPAGRRRALHLRHHRDRHVRLLRRADPAAGSADDPVAGRIPGHEHGPRLRAGDQPALGAHRARRRRPQHDEQPLQRLEGPLVDPRAGGRHQHLLRGPQRLPADGQLAGVHGDLHQVALGAAQRAADRRDDPPRPQGGADAARRSGPRAHVAGPARHEERQADDLSPGALQRAAGDAAQARAHRAGGPVAHRGEVAHALRRAPRSPGRARRTT